MPSDLVRLDGRNQLRTRWNPPVDWRTVVLEVLTGTLMGADPTGKQMRFMGIDIVRISDGKLVEHWGQVDVLAAIDQLGFLPF